MSIRLSFSPYSMADYLPCVFWFTQCKLFVFAQLYNLSSTHYLQILYLDALDTGDIVDQTAKLRASVWTRSLVTRITTRSHLSLFFSLSFSWSINLHVVLVSTYSWTCINLHHHLESSWLYTSYNFFCSSKLSTKWTPPTCSYNQKGLMSLSTPTCPLN